MGTPMQDNERLSLSIRILALAFLAGVLISWPLWLSGRTFPLSPALSLPVIPRTASVVMLAAFCTALVLLFLFPLNKPVIRSVFILALAEALLDQNRWQPWVYQYVLMLFLLLFYSGQRGRSGHSAVFTGAFRLIICGIYFWSGIQKFNPDFFSETSVWLTEPLGNYFGKGFAALAGKAACSIPVIELFLAFGLLVRSTRKIAMIIAIAMHTYIALLTTPLGRDVNYVILPWNLGMIALLLTLFRKDNEVSIRSVFSAARQRFVLPVFLLTWFMPLFSCFGLWDSYLSASLYTGNSDNGFIYISKQVRDLLPAQWKQKVYSQVPDTKPDTLYYIYINECAMQELHAPAYPETRIFKRVKKEIENSIPDDWKAYVTLVVQRKWTWVQKSYYDNVN